MKSAQCLKLFGSALILATSMAALAAAQEVLLRGKVEDTSVPREFVLDQTIVRLQSMTIDLNAFVGLHAEIRGTNLATSVNPLIEVSSINPVEKSFELDARDGEMKIGVIAAPGSRTWVFADLAPGYRPFGAVGTFLLSTVFPPIPLGLIPPSGGREVRLQLPDDPGLIGLAVWGQALVLTPSGSGMLTNADHNVIGAN